MASQEKKPAPGAVSGPEDVELDHHHKRISGPHNCGPLGELYQDRIDVLQTVLRIYTQVEESIHHPAESFVCDLIECYMSGPDKLIPRFAIEVAEGFKSRLESELAEAADFMACYDQDDCLAKV